MDEARGNADRALRELVAAIVAADSGAVDRLLAASPQLTTASFFCGATRGSNKEFFVDAVRRYVIVGDTALHFAAAAYESEIARRLVTAGARVRAGNRFGDEPLHAAAAGNPCSPSWRPSAQAATITFLIEAGADPNATNKRGVMPLHVAVRSRCTRAVRTLLECGADPRAANGNGSTPALLARQNTGRAGTGMPEAKVQQEEILRLLDQITSP